MIIDIITIFPEMFTGIMNNSIIKRAIEKEIVKINIHDFRLYSKEKHHHVDDTTYGGGSGMIIECEPIVECLRSIDGYQNALKLITAPTGNVLNEKKAYDLSKLDHIIIVCGHYEGIDDRINYYVDEEISIGDYVLTGGEIPALTIIDSVVRLIPGAITEGSLIDESFTNDLLEYPQYTKPIEFEGHKVPDVLLNGNHKEIRIYRLYESLRKTYLKRKDLIENRQLSLEEEFYLGYIKKGYDYQDFINLGVKYNSKTRRLLSKQK